MPALRALATMILRMEEVLSCKVGGVVMKKVFLFMAAFAALVSCVKEGPMTNETPDLEETPVVEEKIVSITAVGPEVADPNSKPQQQNSQSTKTQLIDGSNVMWSPGDVVKVCFLPKAFSDHTNSTKYGYNTNFTYSGTELSEAASFQGTWGPAKANLLNTDGFVVYPGNSDNFTFSACTLFLYAISSSSVSKISWLCISTATVFARTS